MRFFDFEEKMRNYPFFTTQEVRNVFFDLEKPTNQLVFWFKKGYLKKIKKGLYLFSAKEQETNPLFFAGKIYEPSYLSLEFALNYYGIIPDIPGTYTSVTSRKTKNFQTAFGKFTFQKVKVDFFTGYEVCSEKNIFFNMATPEKALVDYLYLNRHKVKEDEAFWREMRIDEDFRFKKNKLEFYSSLLKNKKVDKLIKSVLNYQKNVR